MKNQKKSRYIVVATTLLLASCATLPDIRSSHTPKNQVDAGTVHVAALPFIPWSEISEKIEPNFKMTSAQDALSIIAPITQFTDIRQSNRFGVSGELAFAGTTKTKSLSETSQIITGDEPSETGSTEASFQRDFTSASRPEVAAAIPDSLAGTAGLITTSPANIDPFLQYRSAAALYQEVQILNKYLSSVETLRGYEPYLARLQLTVHPYSRKLDYDIYTTINFELEETQGHMKIIPLVINDSLERSSQKRIAEAVNQISFNVNALAAGNGVGAELKKEIADLRNYVGQDFNSLRSLSKVDENTLIVRTGAPLSGSSRYSIIPRSYDITFLALLPKQKTPEEKKANATKNFAQILNKLSIVSKRSESPYITGENRRREVNAVSLFSPKNKSDSYTNIFMNAENADREIKVRNSPDPNNNNEHVIVEDYLSANESLRSDFEKAVLLSNIDFQFKYDFRNALAEIESLSVPESDDWDVSIKAFPEFRSTRTGKKLPSRSNSINGYLKDDLKTMVKKLEAGHGWTDSKCNEKSKLDPYNEIPDEVQNDCDIVTLIRNDKIYDMSKDQMDSVITLLTPLSTSSRLDMDRIRKTVFGGQDQIAISPPIRLLPRPQTVIFTDDAKNNLSAEIHGIKGYSTKNLSAKLCLELKDGTKCNANKFGVKAKTVQITDAGTVKLNFPSLKSLKNYKDLSSKDIFIELDAIDSYNKGGQETYSTKVYSTIENTVKSKPVDPTQYAKLTAVFDKFQIENKKNGKARVNVVFNKSVYKNKIHYDKPYQIQLKVKNALIDSVKNLDGSPIALRTEKIKGEIIDPKTDKVTPVEKTITINPPLVRRDIPAIILYGDGGFLIELDEITEPTEIEITANGVNYDATKKSITAIAKQKEIPTIKIKAVAPPAKKTAVAASSITTKKP